MGLSPGSVGFQMQPSVALERRPMGVPIEPGLHSNVAQREHHAFLHRLEAADVEIGVRIGDAAGRGRPRARASRPARSAWAGRRVRLKAKLMSMKSFGRLPSGPKYGSSSLVRAPKNSISLPPSNLPDLRKRRRHSVIARIGALPVPVQIIDDRALRMVRHEEAHAERPGHLDLVADVQVAEIVADDSARRAGLGDPPAPASR